MLPAVFAALSAALPAPDEATARHHLEAGRKFASMANASRAWSHFQAAFQADPRSGDPLVEMAELRLEEDRDEDEARLFVLEALRRHPQNPRALALAESLGLATGEAGSEPAERVVVRYLGVASGDGRRSEGSLAVGARLERDLLLIGGFSKSGQPAPLEPDLSVSAGLRLETAGAAPAIEAGDVPSAGESIIVTDRRTGVSGRTSVRVLGPLARIRVANSIARRAAQEEEALAPGSRTTFSLSLQDAAGNPLHRARLVWRARGGEGMRPSWLADPDSVRHADFFFEPHRNHVVVPADAPEGTVVEVTAREPQSGVSASFRVRAAGRDAVVAPPSAAPSFLRGTFEEALERAKRERTLAMIVFTADW